MTGTDIEAEIRNALLDGAARYPLPADLADRTLEAAREAALIDGPEGVGHRRHWVHGGRWVYAAAAVVVIPVLFAIGVWTTKQPNVSSGPSSFAGTSLGAAKAGSGAVGLLNPASVAGPSIQGSAIQGASGTAGHAQAAPAAGNAATPVPADAGFAPSVMRTADVGVQVAKGQFQGAWAQANAVAAHYGGLVSDSSAQTVNGRLALGTLTLQVPSTDLDGALGDLQHLGKTTSLSTSSQDVSGQVADTSAQLTALQAEEAEYLALLPGAKTTADILAIQAPLNTVNQQIQSLQASQTYLQNQVSMASIQATVSEPGAGLTVRPPGRFATAWQRAKDGASAVLAGAIIALGYLIAPAVLAFAAWMIARRLRRRVV